MLAPRPVEMSKLSLRLSYSILPTVVFCCFSIPMATDKSSRRFPSDDRELRDIWADAYAAWDFGNYSPQGQVQYIKPVPSEGMEAFELGDLHLPHPVIFEITAFNPAALTKSLPSIETNFKRLRQLRERILKLSSPRPAMVVHSFGFDKTWREDGCMVAYSEEEDREKARTDLIQLGVEFGQGAIYEIQQLPGDTPGKVATRTTVPCSREFEETSAIVKITGTNAPLEFPDMIWDPIKYYRAQEFEAMLTRAIDDDEEEEEL